MLIYAGNDAIVPQIKDQNNYDFLETIEEDKGLVIFENIGHIVSHIEHDRFNKKVNESIEKYN